AEPAGLWGGGPGGYAGTRARGGESPSLPGGRPGGEAPHPAGRQGEPRPGEAGRDPPGPGRPRARLPRLTASRVVVGGGAVAALARLQQPRDLVDLLGDRVREPPAADAVVQPTERSPAEVHLFPLLDAGACLDLAEGEPR